MAMIKNRYIPKKCVFEATLRCNLKCRHCGSRAGIPRPDELDINEIRGLFSDLATLGCQWVTIAGGEPMARDDWPEVIEAVSQAGIRCGMLTNGIAFNAETAKIARDRGLEAVGFSVDGLREAHDRIRGRVGHFNRLMRAMEAATEVGLGFAVVSFVNSLNIRHLDEMHDLIRDKGAYSWQLQMGADMGNLHDHPELLIKPRQLPSLQKKIADLIRRKEVRIDIADSVGYFGPEEQVLRSSVSCSSFGGCHAGRSVIGIESNGNVKGCLSIMAGYNEKGKSFVEGNIREESLADIWNRPGGFAYTREWCIEDLSGFCRECKHAERCRGGCTSKKVASGEGTHNPLCVYRVIQEEKESHRRASQAAAVVLAGVLGVSAESCSREDDVKFSIEEDTGTESEGSETDADVDADADSDTDTDTDGDTDSDTDTDTDGDTGLETDNTIRTDFDEDTSSDSETEGEVDAGSGETDTETETALDTASDPVLFYGIMPLYGMADTDTSKDTDSAVMKYGMLPRD
jgi:radical SAM protein with 4Fe4S-binding SPASM domain